MDLVYYHIMAIFITGPDCQGLCGRPGTPGEYLTIPVLRKKDRGQKYLQNEENLPKQHVGEHTSLIWFDDN